MQMRWCWVLLVWLLALLAACGTTPTAEPEAAAEADTEPIARRRHQ